MVKTLKPGLEKPIEGRTAAGGYRTAHKLKSFKIQALNAKFGYPSLADLRDFLILALILARVLVPKILLYLPELAIA